MGERGELRPFTLLSYKGGYHSRWPQGRRGRGRGPWFFFNPLWGGVLSPQTARNGRPGAVKGRGEEEDRGVSMESCTTPDGPKWAATRIVVRLVKGRKGKGY